LHANYRGNAAFRVNVAYEMFMKQGERGCTHDMRLPRRQWWLFATGDIQGKPCPGVMELTAESLSSTKTKKFWKIEMQQSTPARITVS